ncbi:MAG: FAD-binding oxidoreductase [Rhizobiales bacterium]|nr:FAD-binding oxidoreductase [Hyphomicrobiales bacterium]
METADVIVIGAGIAGASVSYELSTHGKVVVLEAEAVAGYHATGRSAAIISENYGPVLWSRLVTASRRFLAAPPEGFSQTPLLSPRGALFLAREGEHAALTRQADALARRGAFFEVMPAREALAHCPVLRPDQFETALYEPDCKDIDTNALLSGYIRGLQARGGRVEVNAPVRSLERSDGVWRATTPRGTFEAPVVINAAGGWAREVSSLAGLSFRNVVPFRRTAVLFNPPAGYEPSSWPMTFDVAETFYFKPEAGRVMVSPVDMAACEPCDAQADELEVALAIDRIHRFTTMDVRAVTHKWGGLRTFAPDHEPVIGPDPEQPTFIWLAGQGGNGVMAAAAAARLAASFAAGRSIPQDIAALGLTAASVSPGRPCVIDAAAGTPTVGCLAAFQ